MCKSAPHKPSDCDTLKNADCEARWNLVKRLQFCFRCMRYKSSSHRCKPRKCNIEGCAKAHHPLLHSARSTTNGKKEMEIVASNNTQKPSISCAFLKIVPVRVTGPRRHIHTHTLLDEVSTVTLVDATLVTRIETEGFVDPLCIEAIAGTKLDAAVSYNHYQITLHIKRRHRGYKLKAITIDNLKLAPQSIKKRDFEGCRHLRNIETFLKYENAQPSLLIGQDNWHLLVVDRLRKGSRSQPTASRTPLE
ncbi:hypothetical protein EVAR_16123_1 [Eumeta japonica]|uniref:Peptidase aspartic putative domain-containing protein n=1 Tax=Eumeta variegata TaxID=151549 RepID=A0A4C1UIW6_EUMVA|nr:hypothetical protein EVAR_16123_1 [Eumeta japonica]